MATVGSPSRIKIEVETDCQNVSAREADDDHDDKQNSGSSSSSAAPSDLKVSDNYSNPAGDRPHRDGWDRGTSERSDSMNAFALVPFRQNGPIEDGEVLSVDQIKEGPTKYVDRNVDLSGSGSMIESEASSKAPYALNVETGFRPHPCEGIQDAIGKKSLGPASTMRKQIESIPCKVCYSLRN